MVNQDIPSISLEQENHGQIIRYYRKHIKHWTSEQLGELYGNLIYGRPISGRMVQFMEKNNALPSNPKRREILARLLDIPLFMLGIENTVLISTAPQSTLESVLRYVSRPRNLNIAEYAIALDTFWNKYNIGKAQDVMPDAIKRVNNLHHAIPYVSSNEKESLLRLLCGYNIALANIAQSRRHFSLVAKLINNALSIARENGYYDIQADALVIQGHTYRNQADTYPDRENSALVTRYLTAALQNYTAIAEIEQFIGPKVRDFSKMMTALTQSLLAQDNADVIQSLKAFDAVEKRLDITQKESGSRVIRFNTGDYHYDRASTLMAAPIKKLRFPDLALDNMIEAEKLTPANSKIRHTGIYTRQSRIYLDKGYYPIAIALANEAIALAKSLEEPILFSRIEVLYREFKASIFGNDFEVAQLGAELMKAQNPGLSNASEFKI